MTILSNWDMDDCSIYIPEHNTLIIGDVHFSLSGSDEYKNIKSRINILVDKFQPSRLIFNGDTFNRGKYHREVIDILDNIKLLVDNIILLEGNHEKKSNGFNSEISRKFTVDKEYIMKDILVHHGHRTPSQKANHHIVNHLHPRKEKRPVYLHCSDCYYGSSVTVLPSFSKRVGGVEYTDYNVNIPIITDGKPIEEYDYIFA